MLLFFNFKKDIGMNQKVLKKMYSKGAITSDELKAGKVSKERYDMFVAGVELLTNAAKNPKAQKEAYEQLLETISTEAEVKKVKGQIKKLEKVLGGKYYKPKKKQLKLFEFKETKAKTQKEEVIRHLEDEGKITSWEAFTEYGITRLSAIIFLLRHEEGMSIETETVNTKNRYNNPVRYAKYIVQKEEV